jgi:hypothetical protein
MAEDDLMTYQEWLVLRVLEHGGNIFTAQEAVASVLLDDPAPYAEDDRRTYEGWVSR